MVHLFQNLENIWIITLIFLWTVTGATRRQRVAIATDWMTNCEWSDHTSPRGCAVRSLICNVDRN
jgi:hypothetical protein